MGELKFGGANGRKPQAEARRYVYAVAATMLENELGEHQRNGWMFGGLEEEPDRRRVALMRAPPFRALSVAPEIGGTRTIVPCAVRTQYV
jgi:hypothetical protein